jgi:hypothetical protein
MFVVTMGTFGPPFFFEKEAGTFMHEFGHTLGLRHGGGDDANRKPLYHSVMNYLYQFKEVPGPWRLDYDRERAVYDDWGNIIYNFRQTNSLLASVANRTVSFKEVNEPPVLDVGDATPGDYNRDGTVNNSDYSTWRSSFGQIGAGLAADGNGNGVVDTADYIVWRNNLGRSSSQGIADGSKTNGELLEVYADALSPLQKRDAGRSWQRLVDHIVDNHLADVWNRALSDHALQNDDLGQRTIRAISRRPSSW